MYSEVFLSGVLGLLHVLNVLELVFIRHVTSSQCTVMLQLFSESRCYFLA